MNHAVYVLATVVAVAAIASGNEFLCDIPTAGCANGMFDQGNCTCSCIPPFCPDADGNCVVSGACDDPWKDCERGTNCPWWPNPLKAESCTTGPKIPQGTWKIFNAEEICCKSSFPYSEFCTPGTDSTPPTKHPTIALLEDNDEDIISIKFVASNIPENIPAGSIEKEMEIVLKRIIFRVAEKIYGMKVTNVEAANLSLNLRRQLGERILSKEVTKYFLVYVVRDDEKQFGPYIINEIRDSYDDILTQIQSFSDTKYLRGDLGLDFCTLYDGEYNNCVLEEVITDGPSPVPQTTAILQPETDVVGLAGWAIALIVVLVLSIFCCCGYAIAVLCCGVENLFKGQDDAKDIENNVYMDKRLGPSESANKLAIMDGMSQYSRKQLTMQGAMRSQSSKQITQGSRVNLDGSSGVQVVCSNPQYPSFGDTFTINTYSTNRRQTRDPTMFISGQESKPDPGTVYSQSQNHTYTHDARSGRRYYSEDPSSKPKREPTMYMDGNALANDPMRKQRRDPSLHDGWQQGSVMEDSQSGYPGRRMRYELEAIDDDVEYAPSCFDPKSVRSQASRDVHETLRGSSSCLTQEQSSSANRKSMKSKAFRRSDKRHHDSVLASESNALDGKSTISKFSSHKSKMSKNTSHSSGVFSG